MDIAVTKKNMRAVALAICKGDPILLEGVTGASLTHRIMILSHLLGSGKTALINQLARRTGNTDLVRIHLGDQTDAKLLLGTYVCTEIPGEFRWVPGVLTQAVTRGLWIVIEDIDLAPVEVQSALLPLLERRELFIPGRGEVLHAKPSFQLFATFTVRPGQAQVSGLLANLWTHVFVEPLSLDDLKTVLETKYQVIRPLIPLFVQTFDLVQRAQQGVSSVSIDGLVEWIDDFICLLMISFIVFHDIISIHLISLLGG